jgi:SEC-C motif-containing protein
LSRSPSSRSRDAGCPCGRGPALQDCCGRFLADFANRPAPDAESLMRSRYTAYVLQDRAYLLATWHATTRPTDLQLDPQAKWLGLDVTGHADVDATHAEVSFVARYRAGGRAVRLVERSRFVREADGRWYYVDGRVA